MDLDLEPPLDDAHDETPDRKGVVALFLDVVRRPAGAMRDLAAHPGRRWILPRDPQLNRIHSAGESA